ncbi:MAG TPA: MarR family transcriptional regulator [Acidimicrobiales bacterium]|nr:MarR family transcriptional regulator [Acidimicrobiales bacterium]
MAQADRLLAALAGVRRSARRLAGRPAELSPLTGAQLELVKLLRRRPDVAVAEAAEELNLAANTVSTLVGQLVEAGLVRRRADPADRRVARLDLTPHMRRKVDAWRDTRVVALGGALARLSTRERRCVELALPVLERLAAELECDRPRPGRRPVTT